MMAAGGMSRGACDEGSAVCSQRSAVGLTTKAHEGISQRAQRLVLAINYFMHFSLFVIHYSLFLSFACLREIPL